MCCHAVAMDADYPEPLPATGADYSRLAEQVDAIIASADGATGVVSASAAEFSAYLSDYLLPLAGASGYRCDVRFADGTATVVLRDAALRPLALLAVDTSATGAATRVSALSLGPIALPHLLTKHLGSVLAATLSSGELGFSLVDARVSDGRAYFTVTRR